MNNENNVYINKWFHFYSTDALFQAHKNSGLISPKSICFLKETMQIYTGCSYFGISSKDFEKLACIVKRHEEAINNIIGKEGPSVNDGILNNLKDFEDFLRGFKEGDNLKEILNSMREALEQSINEVLEHCNKRCDELQNNIDKAKQELKEIIGLLEQRVDANAAEILTLKIKYSNLENTVNKYLEEWKEFRESYDNFFEYVNNRFTSVDEILHSQHEQITLIQENIEEINSELVNIDNRFTEVNNTINNIQEDITNVKEDITNVTNSITEIEENITNITNNIEEIEKNVTEVNNHYTELQQQVTNLSEEITNTVIEQIGAAAITEERLNEILT